MAKISFGWHLNRPLPPSHVPQALPGIPPAQQVGADEGFIVVVAGNQLRSWGENIYGQLGNGTLTPTQATPGPVAIPVAVGTAHLSVGWQHSLLATEPPPPWVWP